MKYCPLLKKKCIGNKCEWFILNPLDRQKELGKCAVSKIRS